MVPSPTNSDGEHAPRTIEREHWTLEEAGPGRLTVRLVSFVHFEAFLRTLGMFGPHFVWRGQARVEWPLHPSLDRLRVRSGWTTDEKFTRAHLDRFISAARGRLPNGSAPVDENAWWAIGQHYGLATPLLDWTNSPFIAAFFAYQEELKEFGQHRCIYGLSRLWVEGVRKGGHEMEFVSPFSHDNTRLLAQDALFTRAPDGRGIEACVADWCDSSDPAVHLLRIEVPDAERLGALSLLRSMNISHRTLFPDLTGAAATTNIEYELGPIPDTASFYHKERYTLDDGSIDSSIPRRVPPPAGVLDPVRSTFRAADPTPKVGVETELKFTRRDAYGNPVPEAQVDFKVGSRVVLPNPFAPKR